MANPAIAHGTRVLKDVMAFMKKHERYFLVSPFSLDPYYMCVGSPNKLSTADMKATTLCINDKAEHLETLLYKLWENKESDILIMLDPGGKYIARFELYKDLSPLIIKLGEYLYIAYSVQDMKKAIANNLYLGLPSTSLLSKPFSRDGSMNRMGRKISCNDFRTALMKDNPKIDIDLVEDTTGAREVNAIRYFILPGNKYLSPVRYNMVDGILYNAFDREPLYMGEKEYNNARGLEAKLKGAFGETILNEHRVCIGMTIRF